MAIARLRPKSGIEKLNFSIPANSSLEIFRRSLVEFQSGKFILTFTNPSNEVKALEFFWPIYWAVLPSVMCLLSQVGSHLSLHMPLEL